MSDTKKPLSAAEFESYIKSLVFSYENKLSEQKDRIFMLVEENKKLSKELNGYKEKDGRISQALTAALQKAKEIEDAAQKKYNIEIERLRLFHSKWTAYYAFLRSRLPVDKNMLSAEEFLLKMDRILGFEGKAFSDNNIEAVTQFIRESKRLDKSADNIEMPQNDISGESMGAFGHSGITVQPEEDDSVATVHPKEDDSVATIHPKENISVVTVRSKKDDNVTVQPEENLDLNEVLNPKDLPALDVLIKEMGILDK